MDKLIALINWFFDQLESLFNLILPGKPSRSSKTYPRQRYEDERKSAASGVPSAQKQVELYAENDIPPEYRKSKSLLTYRERVLFRALHKANDGEFAIMVKVRMGDFVYLANEPVDRKYHNNQVLCKHVDFLFCDKITLEPLLVIELDDSSHRQHDHRERDKFKDDTFIAVGLPFLRIELQKEYDSQQLRRLVKEKVGERPADPIWD